MSRFLTQDEKDKVLAEFAELRRNPDNFRGVNDEGGYGYIDREILELCDALNNLDGIVTLQSCCGHKCKDYNSTSISGYYIYDACIWLRLNNIMSILFDLEVNRLVAADGIMRANKYYSNDGKGYFEEIVVIEFIGLGKDSELFNHICNVIYNFFSELALLAQKYYQPTVVKLTYGARS